MEMASALISQRMDSDRTFESSGTGGSWEQPLLLLRVDSSGNATLNEKAIEALQREERTIGVVGVVGPAGTGKSTLLNRLVGSKFQVARCTSGIWI